MLTLQRLTEEHGPAVLRFEIENRAYFARSVRDRGDDYFVHFAERHAALLAESDCCFHVLIDDDGRVAGRFNLVDVAEGAAELGFRTAEAVAGRGLAKEGVRRVIALARAEYRLDRLTADAEVRNGASRAVLRATGFVETGPVERGGQPCVRHVLELSR
ncbi:GNAT family N-acetyltransferase [Actinoplanes sp. TRM 88003]|uniref:GNAT family N-acetyltransferase n=1 Tax=Paractinoplanes aksuensis TaxID=2939490 RepID=A0ABT1DKX2_9ACTN|nr:GNAT family N-acetyltransferase [Actinoplanes aksuensis]MCO8270416.1 GNAT family N-acetyltransferase [Actinoplanes aksuensis]